MAYRNYSVANGFIVDTTGNGDFTTLASAMTAATSGTTIFLKSSVTETVTITPGVNITAWTRGSLNTPSITGTLTMTGAGTSSISGIELITNSAAIIAVTGSAASILNINNCYLNMGTSAITYSSSSATSAINITNCQGNISTTGVAAFTHTSAGTLTFDFTKITNTGLSTTAATASAGTLNYEFSYIEFATTTSTTNLIQIRNNHINTSAINTTGLTIGGSGVNTSRISYVSSGTASSISVSAALEYTGGGISSGNTNAVTGAGTFSYENIALSNTALFNTTTQVGGIARGGLFQAPSAGFLGENIASGVGGSISIALTGTWYNLNSILLTPGIWDISAMGIIFPGGTYLGTISYMSIDTTNNGPGIQGLTQSIMPPPLTNNYYITHNISPTRVTITTNTTYYVNAQSGFTSTAPTAVGRIQATRVG